MTIAATIARDEGDLPVSLSFTAYRYSDGWEIDQICAEDEEGRAVKLTADDLFSSVDAYRTYVGRWKALYAEIKARLRASRVVGRYQQAVWNQERCLKLGIKAGIRPGREEAAKQAKPVLSQPRSPELTELAWRYVPNYLKDEKERVYGDRKALIENYLSCIYSSDATMLILCRLAGKRWVKHYHPWKFPQTSLLP